VRFVIYFLIILWLLGCGPRTKIACFKDSSYLFNKVKKNILITIVNYDDWQTKGNEVLVSNIANAVKVELLKAGYNVYTLDVKHKNKKNFKEFLKDYLAKNSIDFHLVITLEPTEQERKFIPPSTYVSYEFMIANVYDRYGRVKSYYWQLPVLRTRGAQLYTYHIVTIDLALYDVRLKKQVWLGKARTKGRSDDAEKFYLKPAIKLVQKLINEFTQSSH